MSEITEFEAELCATTVFDGGGGGKKKTNGEEFQEKFKLRHASQSRHFYDLETLLAAAEFPNLGNSGCDFNLHRPQRERRFVPETDERSHESRGVPRSAGILHAGGRSGGNEPPRLV